MWFEQKMLGRVLWVVLVATPVWAQPVMVPTAVVKPVAVGASYILDGVIEPVKQSTIAAQASGRIVQWLVKTGDAVRKGQLLLTIDGREYDASVQRSQAQLQQTEAELRNAQAQTARTQDLQQQGFVSKAALDTASTQLQGAVAMRAQAAAAVRQSTIAQDFTRVTAPYDGWVLQTFAEAGDLAVPGKPLIAVYAPQQLRATVQVPASRAKVVREAAVTQVGSVDAQGQSQWVTPSARSSVPSADPVSQTTEWRFELPGDSQQWVPGQQVRVMFTRPATTPVLKLLVPESAIVRRGELTAVYVAADKSFNLRAVRLGARYSEQGVEVLGGLLANEVVALQPIRAGFANAQPQK